VAGQNENTPGVSWLSEQLKGDLFGLRPTFDGPPAWLWSVSAARLGMLLLVSAGTEVLRINGEFAFVLLFIYAAAFLCSLWYVYELYSSRSVSATLTWTQILVDFGVVAATVSFTGGPNSLFTFLFVVVILEAGVIMGILQGFIFAMLATAFVLFEAIRYSPSLFDQIIAWYNILIQGIAFFFTAFISGYWNQRLSRMKQFQREILDNMNNGFLIADAHGKLIALNKAGCEILGFEGDVSRGVPVSKLMRSESGAECPVDTALRSGKDFTSYEFFVMTHKGASKLLGLTTNRILGPKGAVTSLIASFTDLTDMARMRQEMQQQDRMAAIGELTASLAHEIRNPVASIRGAMDEMRGNMDSPDMMGRLAKIAIRESDHLNELVTGFLDFARDPNKRHQRVDITPLIEEVRTQCLWKHNGQNGAGAGGALGIELRLPAEPCEVMANPTQIKQVFTNLCDNAAEAMGGKGQIIITVEMPEVKPDSGTPGPVIIQVEDEGPGIEPNLVARIFEPFYTSKERGVGMGLAICMRLITAHDGTIQAASRPGKGTTFSIRLPRAPHYTD